MSDSVSADVTDVIKKMLNFIPIEETQLINDLKIFEETLWNQAPELRCTYFWIPMTSILQRNIECVDQPWKIELTKIFNAGKAESERLFTKE